MLLLCVSRIAALLIPICSLYDNNKKTYKTDTSDNIYKCILVNKCSKNLENKTCRKLPLIIWLHQIFTFLLVYHNFETNNTSTTKLGRTLDTKEEMANRWTRVRKGRIGNTTAKITKKKKHKHKHKTTNNKELIPLAQQQTVERKQKKILTKKSNSHYLLLSFFLCFYQ